MVQAKLTLTALYNYDPSIFDGLEVPIEKQTVIDSILLECMPFETLFPQPEFMKQAITIWSNSCQTVWNHLYETMNYEYNPIWNKDGSVTETSVYGAKKRTDTYGTDKMTNVDGAQHAENVESVAGFNSDTFSDHTKNESDVDSVTNTQTRDAHTDQHSDDTYTDTHTRIEKGNIGITTTQQMIQEERNIAEFNLIRYITEDFKNRFCIVIY